MDNHNEKNTEWIIAGNPDKYDVVGAFRELGIIDWTQSSNINVGDIVYIYVSNTVRAIRFKCKVNVVNKVTPTIDDSKFNISGDFDVRRIFHRFIWKKCIRAAWLQISNGTYESTSRS